MRQKAADREERGARQLRQFLTGKADFEGPLGVLTELIRQANELLAQAGRDLLRGNLAEAFLEFLQADAQQSCGIATKNREAIGDVLKSGGVPNQSGGWLSGFSGHEIVRAEVRLKSADQLTGTAQAENDFATR